MNLMHNLANVWPAREMHGLSDDLEEGSDNEAEVKKNLKTDSNVYHSLHQLKVFAAVK